jgi:hypothetical protein
LSGRLYCDIGGLSCRRLIYEKSKTEAIIESVEDGIVLIQSAGIVTHIDEIAALNVRADPLKLS